MGYRIARPVSGSRLANSSVLIRQNALTATLRTRILPARPIYLTRRSTKLYPGR